MEERETELTVTREFGRTLTFLYRSRAKYMGERLRDYGFAGAMFMILLHVDRHPGVSQDRIANHLYIDKCNVARRTKKLEELGYLYRETDPDDRRQNKLYLTPQGAALAPEIRACLESWARTVTAGLSDTQREELLSLLLKTRDGVKLTGARQDPPTQEKEGS